MPLQRHRACLGSLVASILWLGDSASAAQQPDRPRGDTPVATAQRTTGAIHIDGRLDEPDWHMTSSIGPLTQREPMEGHDATEATDVRILFDDDALYIGIQCHESHPRGFVSTQLTRDANLDVDDRVTIVLDPFFDHRNGFFFQINPAGARSDGQRIAAAQFPESVQVDPEARQRFVCGRQSRVGEVVRRPVRINLRASIFKASVHTQILIQSSSFTPTYI